MVRPSRRSISSLTPPPQRPRSGDQELPELTARISGTTRFRRSAQIRVSLDPQRSAFRDKARAHSFREFHGRLLGFGFAAGFLALDVFGGGFPAVCSQARTIAPRTVASSAESRRTF